MKDQSSVPPCPRAQGFIWFSIKNLRSYLGGNCLVATKGCLKKPRGRKWPPSNFYKSFLIRNHLVGARRFLPKKLYQRIFGWDRSSWVSILSQQQQVMKFNLFSWQGNTVWHLQTTAGSDLKKPSLASQDSSRFRSEDFLQPGLTSYDYSRSWWRFLQAAGLASKDRIEQVKKDFLWWRSSLKIVPSKWISVPLSWVFFSFSFYVLYF